MGERRKMREESRKEGEVSKQGRSGEGKARKDKDSDRKRNGESGKV